MCSRITAYKYHKESYMCDINAHMPYCIYELDDRDYKS